MFDHPQSSLRDLDTIEPGFLLAAALDQVDVRRLRGIDRVIALRAFDRMAAHYEAARARAMAALTEDEEFTDLDPAEAIDAAAAEARIALTLTRRAAESDLHDALELRDRLPSVLAAWRRGLLDRRRVQVILRGTAHLSGPEAERVAELVLEDASRLTTGQLRARVGRIAMEADPVASDSRFRDAHADRRVWISPTDAGTATLTASDLSPERATAIQRRIHGAALALRRAGDQRTIDQLRADVLVDILEGAEPPTAIIEVTTDLPTLTELAAHPGDLAGYGPVVADIARRVAESKAAEWRFTVEDGGRTHRGAIRRHPTESTARSVRTMHPTCVFPGCRMPASECDLDH
ncbi:MAG: DUF222 domain-containing protein, partial [Acidimicrobiia bacterium]|nr:DUF222 domain-containing protein [Acidimicrobiia bacterium]